MILVYNKNYIYAINIYMYMHIHICTHGSHMLSQKLTNLAVTCRENDANSMAPCRVLCKGWMLRTCMLMDVTLQRGAEYHLSII